MRLLLLLALGAPALAGHTAVDLAEVLPDAYTVDAGGPRADDSWWRSLGGDELDGLMRAGLSGNGDLAAFTARVEQSEALARAAGAPLIPTVSFDVSTSTAPLESLGFMFGGGFSAQIPDPPVAYHTGSALLKATWTPDLSGANTLAFKASRLDARATEGDRDAQAIALATRIAQGWVAVETAHARLALVQEQVRISEELLGLAEARYGSGLSTAQELLQQRQQVAAVQALLPGAQAQVRSAEQSLVVLIGGSPDQAGSLLPPIRGELPELPPRPGLGSPEDLLRTRPDLRAAVLDVDVATARVRSAQAGLVPTVGLSANAGWQGLYIKELTTQPIWGVGFNLSVPLVQGGRELSNLQAAQASRDATMRSLEQLARQAVFEVQDAAWREEAQGRALEAARLQEQAAHMAFDEAREQYTRGLSTYLTVLTALNTWQQAQLSALSAQQTLLNTRIELHDALGGEWPARLNLSGDTP